MRPETLEAYEHLIGNAELPPIERQLAQSIPAAKHFHASADIAHFASETVRDSWASSDFFLPILCRLPASDVVLSVAGVDSETGKVQVFRLINIDDEVGVFVVRQRDIVGCVPIGKYTPGTAKLSVAAGRPTAADRLADVAFMVGRLAHIIALINTPRIISITAPAADEAPRHHRRRVERVTGKAFMAWSSVSWPIGSKAATQTKITTEGHRKALHWCRAHWRRTVAGAPKAEWVAIPRHGAGWFVWVSDSYRGHPDYGVKLQRWQPHMQGETRRGAHAPAAVLNETRLAALSAAHRAALVQSGHVRSPFLH